MSFFKKTPDHRPSNGTSRDRGTRGHDNDLSIIGPGMDLTGDIVTEGTVRVEGRVNGTIRAGRSLVLGKGGEITGDVLTQDALIGGRLTGTLVAEARLELQSTAVIDGEIHAPPQHLQLHEGARFNGQIRMLDEPQEMRALTPGDAASSTEAEEVSHAP
jgi:cytoskeletal protein CcmA (bactofilin family)